MYMQMDEDAWILGTGRRMSSGGLVGLGVGLLLGLIFRFPWYGTLLLALFCGYLGLTGSWGVHGVDRWARRFRYRMPSVAWWPMRVIVDAAGAVAGLFVWGLLEHLFLLIAVSSTREVGLIQAQIVLLPWVGPRFDRRIGKRKP